MKFNKTEKINQFLLLKNYSAKKLLSSEVKAIESGWSSTSISIFKSM